MCGRYHLDTSEEEIEQIIRTLGPQRSGEIFPTTDAPVITGGERVTPEIQTWGFPDFRGSGVIINARSETAAEKRMFRQALKDRRCVIPSTGFYEWNKEKQKYLFCMAGGERVLYMAGLYQAFKGKQRFVILTTAANSSVSGVHHRMPVVLEKDAVRPWLTNTAAASGLLHTIPPSLSMTEV